MICNKHKWRNRKISSIDVQNKIIAIIECSNCNFYTILSSDLNSKDLEWAKSVAKRHGSTDV